MTLIRFAFVLFYILTKPALLRLLFLTLIAEIQNIDILRIFDICKVSINVMIHSFY